jgi:hypothetical protein
MTNTTDGSGETLRLTISTHCSAHDGPGDFPPGPRLPNGDEMRTCSECGAVRPGPGYEYTEPRNAELWL